MLNKKSESQEIENCANNLNHTMDRLSYAEEHKAGHIGRDHRRCPMKSPECVCKTSEEYIRVALALETLA